jgi:transcriptional regulator with PAS, ATPase and Fis domain
VVFTLEPLDGPPIRPLDDVAREHVEETLRAHPETPRYRVALELGISPTTLYRMLRDWYGEEDPVRDRR